METVVGEGGAPLATAAGQTTGNASVATIATKVSPVASLANPAVLSLGDTAAHAFASQACTLGAYVAASPANTALVYVGGSSVTTSIGTPLAPGDRIWLPVSNTSAVYAITGTATQTLTATAC